MKLYYSCNKGRNKLEKKVCYINKFSIQDEDDLVK